MAGEGRGGSRRRAGGAPSQRFSPLPTAATYVKVYLLENGVCLAKKKTKAVKKTCDPSFQQALLFEESPQGKVLQVMSWGIHRAGRTHPAPPSRPRTLRAAPLTPSLPCR